MDFLIKKYLLEWQKIQGKSVWKCIVKVGENVKNVFFGGDPKKGEKLAGTSVQ